MLILGDKGMKLITSFEGLRLESYLDVVGKWTIGYGTISLNGFPVGPNMVINAEVADALLLGKVAEFLDIIDKNTKNLNQNQIDALASFVYNIGKGGFLKSSLLTFINAGKVITEDLFTRWNKGRVNGQLVELKGLTKRRKAEFKLYMSKEI